MDSSETSSGPNQFMNRKLVSVADYVSFGTVDLNFDEPGTKHASRGTESAVIRT